MSEPIVELSSLQLRDDRGAIHGLDLALPAGPVGALIGSPSDGSTALALGISGMLRPHRGTIRVSGQDPSTTPALRRRMGVLLHDPALPDLGRVRDVFAWARDLRGESPRESWFHPLGLDRLMKRSVAALSRWERRAVALGLALAVPSPRALVLHDPLSEIAGVSGDSLRSLLQSRAREGACVLVLTPSVHDAAALADDVASLERGAIGRAIGAPDVDVLTPGSPVELLVWCDMARSFASALLLAPEITSLSWSSSDGSTPLRIRGTDAEGCARAVARVATDEDVIVRAMQTVMPSASEVHAATAGIDLAMRHQAAYAAQMRMSGDNR